MNLIIHIDGGARGNPGPAGAGVMIQREGGGPLLEAGYFLGRTTNNVAEYTALLKALEAADRFGGTRLDIYSDSELLVRQMNGEYRVKNVALKELFENAMGRLRKFENWRLRHVRREGNARADELANLAMDAGEDVIEVAEGNPPAETRTASRAATTRVGHPEGKAVLIRCTRAPEGNVCTAPCKEGAEYRVGQVTPEGLCIHAAPAIFKSVVGLQRSHKPDNVRCPRRGCGATFSVDEE